MAMLQDIQRELARLDCTNRSLRSFGLLFSAIGIIGAGVLYGKQYPHWAWIAGAGMVFLLAGMLRPPLLRVPYRLWMTAGFALGWITSRLLLALVYFAVLTPLGLLLRALGKDLLDERGGEGAQSYWKKHEGQDAAGRYTKQF